MSAHRSRGDPGFFFSRRRGLAAVVAVVALGMAGCSPRFNFREVKLAEARCVISLPDKPQTAQRELDFNGRRVTMDMTSTGVGPTLFALGVAQLPPEAVAPAQLDATVAWFRDGLLRNVGGTLTGTTVVGLAAPVGRAVRTAQAVTARGRIGADRKAVLAARFYVVDDRLYQVVALGAEGEIPADVVDTFFDSFRLTE
ncbi:MAG: hypothetical protein U5L03_10465 [Burkholderiaceae bacterium]|nr:hypothetical protein [Burkholderiaceae bacterium]